MLYLTLGGDKPSEGSTGGILENGKDYKTISYKEHIIAWLNRAKDIAAGSANVSSSIAQYINLVGQLTKQNEEDKMDADIIDVLIGDDVNGYGKGCGKNLAVAEEIASKIDAAKRELFRRNIGKRLAEELKEYGEVECGANLGEKDSCIAIVNKDWPKDVVIQFFCGEELSDFYVGVYIDGTDRKSVSFSKHIQQIIKDNPQPEYGEPEQAWPCWGYMPLEYRNLLDTATLVRIVSKPTDFCNAVKERVGHYASIIDDALKSTN